MQLQTAQDLALRLMQEHGITDDGWTFRWSHGKQTLGTASYGRKKITLSHYHATLNDEDAVRDTILHEIAHALAGPGNKHNHIWRAWCRRIGAKPERCDTTCNVPLPRYRTVCPVHGTVSTQYRRRRSTVLAGRMCVHCGPSSLGLLRQIKV